MKRKIILTFLILISFLPVSNVAAYTKDEVQKQIREELTDEEFDIIIKESEASKKSFADIFDEIIDPKREEAMDENIKTRRYISTSEKNFNESTDAAAGQDLQDVKPEVIEPEEEAVVPDEKPISVEESEPKHKTKLYPGEKNSNDKKLKAKQTGPAELTEQKPKEEADVASKKEAAKDDKKEMQEDNATLDKRRKEIDRKAEIYRSSDRKKKIEEYNRTKKKKKFGTKRLDEEVEDKGFETEVFKKKEFGTKVFSDRKNKKFDGPADSFEQKGYKRKLLRSGTYAGDDRKTSMFGKDEGEETTGE
jgi:hypothetical protein